MPSIGGYDDLYNQPLTFGTDYYQLDNLPQLDYGGGLFSPDMMPSYDFGTYGTPSPYDFSGTIFGDVGGSSDTGSTFEKFLQNLGGNLFGSGGANNPLGTAKEAGEQLASNLTGSAGFAAAVGQGLGIKGQLIAAGASLLGEDAQLNRETTAVLRAQQLNQTNLAREKNAQDFKMKLAGSKSPQSIARLSNMVYGV
mgnify:CR=1 FL=1